jgi:hypothetical protein
MNDIIRKPAYREYPFKILQGATFTQPVQWKYGDGTPVPIDGYTIKWQIRSSATSKEIIVSGDSEITDGKNGIFLLKLSSEKTSLIPTKGEDYSKLSKYVYDVQMIPPEGVSGVVSRILNGFILVSPGVTR